MFSTSALVSERPSCLAASSQSSSDVTLSQVDPLVTLIYPLALVPEAEVVVVTVAVEVVVATDR